MSIFLCRQSTEQEVRLLSQFQTQKHGILSFSRKPIGSWIEIQISISFQEFLVIQEINTQNSIPFQIPPFQKHAIDSEMDDETCCRCRYASLDMFQILSEVSEVSLRCYFASFERSMPEVICRPKDKECLFSTHIPMKHENLMLSWQDILDCCETFRGEYPFVIPFVKLNFIDANFDQSEHQSFRKNSSDIRNNILGSCLYYTLNCFNYTEGVWNIQTKALASVTSELHQSTFSSFDSEKSA